LKRYEILVNEEYCKGCGICVHFCPGEALELSEEFNEKGRNMPFPADMERCTGCRMCELYCPDLAIAVVEISTSAAVSG